VSYGWTYRAAAPQLAGVTPVGYADGLPRSVSNVGWVGVAGERRPILGRACMDQTVIEVSNTTRVGDLVDVLGGSGMSADEVGQLAGTLNYEVVARLAARVPRIYLRDGEPIAWTVPAECTAGDFAR
jgi:alanine racemase